MSLNSFCTDRKETFSDRPQGWSFAGHIYNEGGNQCGNVLGYLCAPQEIEEQNCCLILG